METKRERGRERERVIDQLSILSFCRLQRLLESKRSFLERYVMRTYKDSCNYIV